MSKSYQQVLAFVFAVEKINKDPHFLPNVSLGFRLYDNYYNGGQTYENVISLLSERDKLTPVHLPLYGYGPYYAYGRPSYNMMNTEKVKIFPNYNCQGKKKMVAVIGGLTSESSVQVANMLGIYKIPQINYGYSDAVLGNQVQFPSLYQVYPSDELDIVAIIQLLLHFDWTWIGLVAATYGRSGNFIDKLKDKMQKNGICPEFVILFQNLLTFFYELEQREKELWRSSCKVVFVCGDTKFLSIIYQYTNAILAGKVWLTTAKWDTSINAEAFSGALSFGSRQKNIPGFRLFLSSVTPNKYRDDVFIKIFWSQEFNCNLPPPYSKPPNLGVRSCTGQERLDDPNISHFEISMSSPSYSICKAVFGVAKALHNLSVDRSKQKTRRNGVKPGNIPLWQMHWFLKKILSNNTIMEDAFFDGVRDLATYDILNVILLPNKVLVNVKVGKVNLHSATNYSIAIHEEMTLWNSKFIQASHVPRILH
ncbi:hypothetical protein JD844_005659 [Phrynosoma platyrhinos]|uniref:Receptor ligand binding region domain-containing protein n=1 Tax=Phrynosoma platyrhinos TaxID=52577 RepID=A0ABQ7TPK5_PHRPL|nr:hypothetical protein JD844_005659 [Phrynosoma platyrhinos]